MLSVALIGAGYWGPNLARNIAASHATRLSWVCDLDAEAAERLAARYPGTEATAAYGDVLSDPGVDGIVIATPPVTHQPLVEGALRAGKHVLVEKPLATSSSEARQMCKLADDAGLVLMCDHTFCYTAAVGELRRLLRSGDLGDFLYYDSVRINLGRLQPDINVLWDLAPHDLSILLYILPPDVRPVRVAAKLADPISYGQPSIGHLSLEFMGGAIAHMHCNWLSPKKIRTTIVGGTRRMAVWDDLTPGARVSIYDAGVSVVEAASPDDRSHEIQYRIGDMIAPALRESEALGAVIDEFACAMNEGRLPATDGRMGVEVLGILEAADHSAASDGVWVPIEGEQAHQLEVDLTDAGPAAIPN
jgi:predicted dehydrogenase